MALPSICVGTQPTFSAASAYFHGEETKRLNTFAPRETVLLKAIRNALHGRDTERDTEVRTATFQLGGPASEIYELAWSSTTVVLSSGGIIQQRWTFRDEGQSIQYAIIGMLECNPNSALSFDSSSHRTATPQPPSTQGRPTFGPFSRADQYHKSEHPSPIKSPAVYVFLRSTGKIFLFNGLEHTFSLPFVVRKAWPLKPHGVLIQRVLEEGEIAEAEVVGEPILPTIFSMTTPYAEPAVIGLTQGIVGELNSASFSLVDVKESFTKPLKSIPATEHVLWVTTEEPEAGLTIIVTVNVKANFISVWRYAYIHPKNLPSPISEPQSPIRKRQPPPNSATNRRVSGLHLDGRDRLYAASPGRISREQSPMPEFAKASDILGGVGSSSRHNVLNRNASIAKNDVHLAVERIVGSRAEPEMASAADGGRMTAMHWMENLYTFEISEVDAASWRSFSIALFDYRYDGSWTRGLLAVTLPNTQTMHIFSVGQDEKKKFKLEPFSRISALSAVAVRVTRSTVRDLLVLGANHNLCLLIHGLQEVPLSLDICDGLDPVSPITALRPWSQTRAILTFEDGKETAFHVDLIPSDQLTRECLEILALVLPAELFFQFHHSFLLEWSLKRFAPSGDVEFTVLSNILYSLFSIEATRPPSEDDAWVRLGSSQSHFRGSEDPAMRFLNPPPSRKANVASGISKSRAMVAPILSAFHHLAESHRLKIDRLDSLFKLVPVICHLAVQVRPEWVDYWRRLVPGAVPNWPTQENIDVQALDDRIPLWPPDASAVFFSRIASPDIIPPWFSTQNIASRFGIPPSYAFGHADPLLHLRQLSTLYRCLADPSVPQSQKRAENAISLMVSSNLGTSFLDALPFGIAAPLREAARTCQLSPPGDWPLSAYRSIGRNDLAASASDAPVVLYNAGYQPVKKFTDPTHIMPTISCIIEKTKATVNGEVNDVSGVELEQSDFTDIRFGQDKRLEEVSRILCSSTTAIFKSGENELNEHDQEKEHHNQVLRIAERTLALPYGRAMFTFGSVETVTREAYSIPQMEYTIRIQPMNIQVNFDPAKVPSESLNWGQFHNGVAAGLRIAKTAAGVESSWIAFNKPSDLTPEHAGFLFALGLTGHLREMLTWHTFGYLTPKHDLTSIGVLLGLSAANIGNGNQHVTKLLAVHTPALLPTPTIDLNLSLMTQAAGLAGVGLLYLGSKNRRMAEVCLNQITRKDLIQPDLTNEHRDAYTYAAGLSFGMVMLGKGSAMPADLDWVSRLNTLIHGEPKSLLGQRDRPTSDLNLTSPAATIAMGLMYMRTERQDIADMMMIPDTSLALNAVQPNFLLLRALSRALIMWNKVSASQEWIHSQIPPAIVSSIESRARHGKPGNVDDVTELAYYNIVAGCCFAIGLKFAGTARQEAWAIAIKYFDQFTRMVYSNGSTFEHKIKRAAIREGLNLISISLAMIMAGTGEIGCFRRLRYAYGMYQQAMMHHTVKYGIHLATHLSIGLLFLGGGRYTLGTSDAAVACMVAAFFPRFNHVSSDSRSYLQALRHLWVLAVEPRCLIARDVDSTEVVYLPVKITMKEGDEIGIAQLISPTLIPDLDKLISLRVDTPRYWPFYLDTQNIPRHKESLLRSQTLYVKRRTAFLSYTEDPRGSRSLFVRSGSSAGDAVILDFPQLTDTKSHPAGDLSEFITSFSNNILFLSFADHFSRGNGDTPNEQLFHAYCHAALLDSILQDKPQTLQSHLTLFRYRMMRPSSRYFHLRLQDLRYATDFYCRVYDRRFSGRSENNPRPALIRESTVMGAHHALDVELDRIRKTADFKAALRQYSCGGELNGPNTSLETFQHLAWYLLRGVVPSSTVLVILKDLAFNAVIQCVGKPPPDGVPADNTRPLEVGIREVLHATGTRMTQGLGTGWDGRSVDEIIAAWQYTGDSREGVP